MAAAVRCDDPQAVRELGDDGRPLSARAEPTVDQDDRRARALVLVIQLQPVHHDQTPTRVVAHVDPPFARRERNDMSARSPAKLRIARREKPAV